jgi:hypothetical protein
MMGLLCPHAGGEGEELREELQEELRETLVLTVEAPASCTFQFSPPPCAMCAVLGVCAEQLLVLKTYPPFRKAC